MPNFIKEIIMTSNFIIICHLNHPRVTSRLDYEGVSTHMGSNGPHFELICLVDMVYKVKLALGSLLCIMVFWWLHKVA